MKKLELINKAIPSTGYFLTKFTPTVKPVFAKELRLNDRVYYDEVTGECWWVDIEALTKSSVYLNKTEPFIHPDKF